MSRNEQAAGRGLNPGFVVCEPTTQQYKSVPCRPEDLEGRQCLGLFLLHHGDGGHVSLSNFRVMAALHRPHSCSAGRGVPEAYVFSMGTGGGARRGGVWSRIFSIGSGEVEEKGARGGSVFAVGNCWRLMKRAWSGEGIDVPGTAESFYFAGRAHGSLYWGVEGAAAALVLDEATAEFSMATLPASTLGSFGRGSFRVIGGGHRDGALRVVRLVDDDLKVFARIDDGKWAVEGLVRPPEATRGLPGREDGYFQGEAVIVDAHDTYVLLTPRERTWLFSVVRETMEVERGHERNKYAGPAYPGETPMLNC